MANSTTTTTKDYKALVSYDVVADQTTYTFPFLYLKKQFVKVRYMDTEGNFTDLEYPKDYKVEDKTVYLTEAGVAGNTIIIYRKTPTEQIVDYVDATVLRAYHLNVNQIQLLHILEEQYDAVLSWSSSNMTYDAGGLRIQNLADPLNAQDAVTKKWFENWEQMYALLLDSNNENWEAENRRIQNVATPVNAKDAVPLDYLSYFINKVVEEKFGATSLLINGFFEVDTDGNLTPREYPIYFYGATIQNEEGETILRDDFFDIDVNGGLEPAVSPTYSRDWELDTNGDVQPKGSVE